MGHPLETGTYYVAVSSNGPGPTSYTIQSRGIGTGQSLGVTDLAFSNGTATITDLVPREAAYFKVHIGPNTPSWEVTLNPTVGELLLAIRRGTVPDIAVSGGGDVFGSTGELKMQKLGAERYVLLPSSDQSFIPEGDYYLAVISEGVNPSSTIGSGVSSGVLTSIGALTATNLGTASVAGFERIREPHRRTD